MDEVITHRLDWGRGARTGVHEAVFADRKSMDQLLAITRSAMAEGRSLLVTRLEADRGAALAEALGDGFAFDDASGTGVIGAPAPAADAPPSVCVVAAGTSDVRVAHEAAATLRFYGQGCEMLCDVGVAGLWRLLEQLEPVERARVVIAVAGMEGALFSVLAGLVRAPLIAVPTSVGYGVAHGGEAALRSALASCAPGVVTVNIDNGFGAACAALKILQVSATGAV